MPPYEPPRMAAVAQTTYNGILELNNCFTMADELTINLRSTAAELAFTLTTEPYAGSFEDGPRALSGRLELKELALRFAYSFAWYGHDLMSFSDEVSVLHAKLTGEALFVNQSGEIELRLFIADQGRGTIGATLDVEHFVVLNEEPKITRFNFDGLEYYDQTHLPYLAKRINQFLRDFDIDVRHPMAPNS
jgi:hypothetical protein